MMDELKGYKKVTKFIMPERCEWRDCSEDGVYVALDIGAPWWKAKMYCRYHVMMVVRYGTIKEEAE